MIEGKNIALTVFIFSCLFFAGLVYGTDAEVATGEDFSYKTNPSLVKEYKGLESNVRVCIMCHSGNKPIEIPIKGVCY